MIENALLSAKVVKVLPKESEKEEKEKEI